MSNDEPSGRAQVRSTTPGRVWVALGFSVTAVTWWLLGNLSEADGYAVMVSLPQGVGPSRLVGAVGLALGAFVAVPSWRAVRQSGAPAIRLVICITLLGLFTGLLLRSLSAETNGANIGGGILLMAAPFIAALPVTAWINYRREERATPARASVNTAEAEAALLVARRFPLDEAVAHLRACADRETLELAARRVEQSLNWSFVGGHRRKTLRLLKAALVAQS